MIKVFVDTDVIIDYTKGRDKTLKDLLIKQDQAKLELFINPIVVAEFFTDISLKNKIKMEKAKELFCFFTTIDTTGKIGYMAGELLREGKVSYLGDALIAATCLVQNLFLVTRNKKHFVKIKELPQYQSR